MYSPTAGDTVSIYYGGPTRLQTTAALPVKNNGSIPHHNITQRRREIKESIVAQLCILLLKPSVEQTITQKEGALSWELSVDSPKMGAASKQLPGASMCSNRQM